jgi:outer membrane receptor protein involved in Fe transport
MIAFKAHGKSFLFYSVGALALSTAQGAFAAQAEGDPLQEVVVTASRVERQGFVAPSPTSVLGQQEMAARPPQSVMNLINEIPAFRPSNSQNSRAAFDSSGLLSPDLRGLGNRRTLVLVDRSRFVPAAGNGTLDLNLIPTNMIERADVVTGGASAAWGSDAVSGVVNLLTKKRFEGLEGQVSWGETQVGDNAQLQGNMTVGGKFNDDRGHIVMGVEYGKANGIRDIYSRDWGKQEWGTVTYPTGAARGGDPTRIVTTQVRNLQNGTYGGVIQGQVLANGTVQAAATTQALFKSFLNANGYNFGPNQNVSFGDGGVLAPQELGRVFGTSTVGGGFALQTGGRQLWMSPELKRYTGMINIEYELTPHITATMQLNAGKSNIYFQTATRRDINQYPTNARPAGLPADQLVVRNVQPAPSGVLPADFLLIRRDNAYLPAPIRAAMVANNMDAFYMGRTEFDLGNVEAHSYTAVYRGAWGLNGDFNAIGTSWKWNVTGELGQTEFSNAYGNMASETRWNRSNDSVIGPAGTPICRVNLPGSATPDAACAPYNPFGFNSGPNLAAARKYMMGTMFWDAKYSQEFAEANISGEPFSTWSGPVSVAVGASYRKDKVTQVSDVGSQANDWDNVNPQPYAGSYNTKEIYGETVIPLIKDVPFFKSVDFNGAARRTDYSTSGPVTTWKTGLTWQVSDQFRFRGAISRDIRAPNILELSGVSTTVTNFTNRYTLLNSGTLYITNRGNPDLKPERAKSLTAGFVVEPHVIPRFRFSVDYYKISVKDAISVFSTQDIVDRCKIEADAGAPGFFCSKLDSNKQFNSNLQVFAINNSPLNLVRQEAEGVDFEAQYSLRLGPGNLNLRAFATRSMNLKNYDVTSATQYSGYLGGPAAGFEGLGGTPKWVGTLNSTYTMGRAMLSLQTRYLSSAHVSTAPLATRLIGPDNKDYNPANPNTISANLVSQRVYFTLSGSYDIIPKTADGRKLQAYFVIDNLLDKDPPNYAGIGNGNQFYDAYGRAFKVGFRFGL